MTGGELAGATVVVTGATSGIGRATATELAGRGARVVLACRSEARARPVLDQLAAAVGEERVGFVALDLGDLDSVRDGAARLLEREAVLTALVNNAGLAGRRGLTASGFELAFGTNHVGHFLLTRLLLDRLAASPGARVVTVASDSHHQAKGIDYAAVRRPTRSLTGLPEYAVSKLANVLFAQELARRAGPGLTSVSLHPGVIASDIWRRIPWPVRPLVTRFMASPEDGARTPVHCVADPEVADHPGAYYDDRRPKAPSPVATPALAAELWERSEEWTA